MASHSANSARPKSRRVSPQTKVKTIDKTTRPSAPLQTATRKFLPEFEQQVQDLTTQESPSSETQSEAGQPAPRTRHIEKAEDTVTYPSREPSLKRARKRSCEAELPKKRIILSTPATPCLEKSTAKQAFECSIGHWVTEFRWPKAYFEPDTMELLFAKKRSTPSLRRKRSGSLTPSSTTPSDQKPREEKSAQYRDTRYETLLATKGSFMHRAEVGITDASKAQIRTLSENEQAVPQASLFQDEHFESACRKIRNRNEARVIRDISQLIVPSAEILATCGARELDNLIESTNEGWNNSIPLVGTRPQPDYSVGFRREAFSDEQHEKLAPFIGDYLDGDQSYFMSTYYMYFPFFTSEVKCGAATLDIADRQNAHSMTLAVRAVVELYRLVQREQEMNREILAFSVSHDHRSVRIYGHYAVVDGPKTTFYRHPVREFNFTDLDGKEKWTAYKFTKSLYEIWVPTHFERLCSAIDDLPSGVSFDVTSLQQDSELS